MGTEKGPKVTLWKANQALVFLASLTPVRDFNMILEAICIPFVAIESYQSSLFPPAMLPDYGKSALHKKRVARKNSDDVWILTDDLYWNCTVSK